VHKGKKPVPTDAFVWKKYGAVEDEDQVQNLAAEPSYVADHHKLISVLD